MSKTELFKTEINYIKDENNKKDLEYLIENLPDYFFEIPASSTGKYHPEYALGEGGLLRHTKVVARFAYELLSNPSIGNKYTKKEKDLMIIACILHDGFKSGKVKEKYTRFDHPLICAEYVRDSIDKLSMSKDDVELIASCIETHMGPWTTDYDGTEVLSPPQTIYQNLVQMCDYLASKKFIKVKFDDKNNIID